MRKAVAFIFALSFAALPVFASADTLTSTQLQVEHLTAIAAALEAQAQTAATGESLACALIPSASTVSVNQPFFLGWGSVGALQPGSVPGTSMYTPEGVNEITIQEPGFWTYTFEFYGAGNTTTSCAATIDVTS